MNKTDKRVTITKQIKAEKTNTICPLINTSVLIIILFSREWCVILLQMERGI